MQYYLAKPLSQVYVDPVEDHMSTSLFGTRIRALREERGITQEVLSDHMGFKDRQTLSAIETGERKVSAEELLRVAKLLAAPLETFTDPFLLIGEGRFSWRQTGVPLARLADYERDAGRWIAAYRVLAAEQGLQPPLDRRSLRLSKTSSYEDAIATGERFATQYELGEVPAQRLASMMQEMFGILVLMVDAITGVSGAACRLPELDTVLINRQEIVGRRHYDLAHELFHILTWDTMPPDHVEAPTERSRNRIEQLANNFASAVLMPAPVLARFGDWSGLAKAALVTKLNETADTLAVTASALKWRLVATGELSAAAAQGLDDALLRNNGHATPPKDLPALFSKPFLDVIARALSNGQLSVRRAAGLLDIAIDDLVELFAAQGIAAEIGV
jgi:Zn-dependent peptidase ImmA (M78 family)/DNA-binding XRE family transcriptional regulator